MTRVHAAKAHSEPMPRTRARLELSRRGRTQYPVRQVAPGVHCVGPWGFSRTVVYLVGSPDSWVLVDAGWPGDGPMIRRAAASVFGEDAAAAAILLTHEHPDHEGDAIALARHWGCPVYLGADEMPVAVRDFAAMQATAMPLDRWVILPIMRLIGRRRRQHILDRASLAEVAVGLTPGQPIPPLPGWDCVATPGHTAGHVSFLRRSDGVPLSGDALVTVGIDTIRGLLRRPSRLSGPPWFTTWDADRAPESIMVLASLRPRVLAGGHGFPLTGPDTADKVAAFANRLAAHPVPAASVGARAAQAFWGIGNRVMVRGMLNGIRRRAEAGSLRASGRTIVSRATIARSPAEVFDYLADIRREREWNDKLLSVEPATGGPLLAGSRFKVRFAGPVGDSVITYHEVDRPSRWRTSSASRILDVRFEGRICASGSGSEVTLRTVLLPRGPLRLLGPLLARTLATSWEHHLATVKRRLEDASGP